MGNKMNFLKSLLVVITLISPLSANAVVLTFDDATTAPLNPYTSNGYTLQASVLGDTSFTANMGQSDLFNFGEDYLSISGLGQFTPIIILTNSSVSPFNLLSLDLGSGDSNVFVNVTVSSVDGLGNVIAQVFNNLSSLSNFVLSGFNDVSIVTISALNVAGSESTANLSIDNLNVASNISTVPVPAAAWLFGSALLGFLGFSRRKLK